MRANAWERIGKELKIKRNLCVSSRDVRIVYPRLRRIACERHDDTCGVSQYVPGINFTSIDRSVVTFRIDLWQPTRCFWLATGVATSNLAGFVWGACGGEDSCLGNGRYDAVLWRLRSWLVLWGRKPVRSYRWYVCNPGSVSFQRPSHKKRVAQ
jgi:hypothetical protein